MTFRETVRKKRIIIVLKLEPTEKPDNTLEYRELVGSLMYLSICTRPDIAFACSYLGLFFTCFDSAHFGAAKRVLRYLAGTSEFGLKFVESNDFAIKVYADANFAKDVVDRRSYTGLLVKIGDSTVNWEARKQKVVAMSTAEAEYNALCEGAKEAKFLKNLLRVLYICDVKDPVKLFSDSLSAQGIVNGVRTHKRVKHIDTK